MEYGACRICGYPPGEHSVECPAYTPDSSKIAESRIRASLRDGGEVRYSGTEFEEDLFGSLNTKDAKYKNELESLGADPKTGYLPREKAVFLAKTMQTADPTNPEKDFLRELRLAVAEKLGLKDQDALKAYTAIGTPLDRFHGVDAFLTEYMDGIEYMVTLDATLRKEKLTDMTRKADIMIGEMPSPDEDEEAYLAAITVYADLISEKFRMAAKSDRNAA